MATWESQEPLLHSTRLLFLSFEQEEGLHIPVLLLQLAAVQNISWPLQKPDRGLTYSIQAGHQTRSAYTSEHFRRLQTVRRTTDTTLYYKI